MQPITVQFDTGSAIVYVLTDKCTDDCNAQTKFKVSQPSKNDTTGGTFNDYASSIENNLDNRIEYGYGSGYINGALADQQLCFANSKTAPCVEHVKILQADQATGVSQDKFAGIVGLSPKSTEKQLMAFVQQVTEANKFSESDQLKPQFSVYLSPDPHEDGSITFGGYDVAAYAKKGSTEGDIFWSKIIDDEKYWTVPMTGATFSKAPLKKPGAIKVDELPPLAGVKAKNAIMDTGVSYALIPTRDFILIQ